MIELEQELTIKVRQCKISISACRVYFIVYLDVYEPAQGIQAPPTPFPSPPKQVTDLNEQSPDESNGNAVSIAEAYPEESHDTELNQENEVFFEPKPTITYETIPPSDNIKPTSPATAKPIIAQPPKINVDIENNEDDDDFVPVVTKVQQQPGQGQGSWPLNNFFPIAFGSTSGGAIAIANSFSTGKGGTAASRATAYGSSSKQKLKKQMHH